MYIRISTICIKFGIKFWKLLSNIKIKRLQHEKLKTFIGNNNKTANYLKKMTDNVEYGP